MKYNWQRGIGIIVSLVISVLAGVHLGPLAQKNDVLISNIVNVFSILSGFMVAVIALTADSFLKKVETWQEMQLLKAQFQRRLYRQSFVLLLYFVTLIFSLFVLAIQGKYENECIYFILIFLCTLVLILSITIPFSLVKMQIDYYESSLNERLPKPLKNPD